MADEQSTSNANAPDGDHIDANDKSQIEHWAKKLDAAPHQIEASIKRVGNLAADVEMDLKGSHATTNADQEERAEQASKDK